MPAINPRWRFSVLAGLVLAFQAVGRAGEAPEEAITNAVSASVSEAVTNAPATNDSAFAVEPLTNAPHVVRPSTAAMATNTLSPARAASRPRPLPLSSEVRHEDGPGLTPVDRVYVTYGSNRFAFVTPPGLRLEVGSKASVTLGNHDGSCRLSFRPLPIIPGESYELTPPRAQKMFLAEHYGAKILDRFSLIADSRAGPAFDFQWMSLAGLPQNGRVAFIPSASCILEFSMVCPPGQVPLARQLLSTVMLTFRANDTRGELRVPELSNKL